MIYTFKETESERRQYLAIRVHPIVALDGVMV